MNQIAIEGCCHGDLDNIYGTLQHLERVEGKKIDLLICCGDFQVCMCHWEGYNAEVLTSTGVST